MGDTLGLLGHGFGKGGFQRGGQAQCGGAAAVDRGAGTAGDLRHYFDKCGGNLGQSGSVMFMFDRKGVINIEAEGLDEDTVMEAALEAGADDFEFDGDVFCITCEPNDLGTVRDALEEAGYKFLSAEVEYIPQTMTALTDEESVKKMEKLIDMLEENDDVQAVWHNWEMPEE